MIYRADGIVRLAEVNDRDRTKLRDPTFRAFAERAMHAVRDPKCSNLPLPERDRGAIGSLHVTFKP